VSHAETQPQPQSQDAAVDQLSFLDLLYAVPIGDLAMRVSGADLSKIPAPNWLALSVVLAVIVLSWIGLHKDRAITMGSKRPAARIGDISFWSIEFVQFTLEIVIVGLYFAMGLTLNLPTAHTATAQLPSQSWLLAYLMFIYGAYLVWDQIDVSLAKTESHTGWQGRAKKGRTITASFGLGWVVLYVLVRVVLPNTADAAIGLYLVMLALLYIYRVVQDCCGNTKPG
jgi:hypothetical protein